MRVSLIQLDVGDDEPVDARVRRAAELVRAEREADLVVLPELWPQGAFAYRRWEQTAEPLDGPTVAALGAAAREIGAHVHMGSLIERAGTGELFNTSVVLSPDGEVAAAYRKIHRFGFSDGEPRLLAAGREPVVYDAGELGRWGLATCYDLRFPEMFRALVDRGAQAVVLVAGWPAARIEHWSLLARARAVEDQVFVLGCNATGQQGSTALGGRSVVVDPWGAVVVESGEAPDTVRVDVDLTDVERTRADFPVLADRVL